ncbi:DUF4360 domain-containing protein [Pendulispora albinea]|uniref:DUF4360 domain-containing protein n=1 Tax=Pendulispora albinea TaxID=2741071 RepID=A0ABZ2LVK7_9BACT
MPNVISAMGAGLSLLAMLWPGDAVAASDDSVPPPDDKITISVVTVNGSGCPKGTADVDVSPDKTTFSIAYDDFTAQAGGGSDPTDMRKNCQVNLHVHIPQGFTYAIARADYVGFARLAPGARALQRASYYFTGTSPTPHRDHTFAGPFHDDWHTTDITDVAALVYKPCGEDRNLNINAELRVNAGSSDPRATSFISMDASGGRIRTTYHFSWKKCT